MQTTSFLSKIRVTLLTLVTLFVVSCSGNRVQTGNLVILLVEAQERVMNTVSFDISLKATRR